MRMSLIQIRTDQCTTVELVLEGSARKSDAPLLQKTLRLLIRQGYATLLVNLGRTRSLDRSCWDRLISAGRELRRRGGRLILHHCPGNVYAELQARKWEGIILVPEHGSIDAAMTAVNLGEDLTASPGREADAIPIAKALSRTSRGRSQEGERP